MSDNSEMCKEMITLPEIVENIFSVGIFSFYFWKDQFKLFRGFEIDESYVREPGGRFTVVTVKIPIYQITTNFEVNFGQPKTWDYYAFMGIPYNIAPMSYYEIDNDKLIVGWLQKLYELSRVCKTWYKVVNRFKIKHKNQFVTAVEKRHNKLL
jgi:hypothetical protein